MKNLILLSFAWFWTLSAAIALFSFGVSRGNAAVVLSEQGSAPIPGANDVSQLSTTGDTGSPGGQNYYSNNGNPPGEQFTTAGGAASYFLTDIYVQTANGSGNGIGPTTSWTLSIYSVSGSSGTLVKSYSGLTTGVSFNNGDWLHFSGLSLTLSANTTYAYTISSGGSAYTGLENSTTSLPGAKAVLIKASTGAITSATGFNGVFDISLTPGTVALSQQASAPAPSADDVSQLNTNGDTSNPGGQNYFSNNGNPPGEQFATGGLAGGYTLTDVYINTGNGSGNNIGSSTPWTLSLYSVSGSEATLITNYAGLTTDVTFTNGGWLHFSGLLIGVAANTTYAYSVSSGSSPYTGLENSTNLLAGAEAVLINPGSGAITAATAYNGVFDIGLAGNCVQPDAPTNVAATAGNDQITVSWTPPVGTVTGYDVYRSITSGSGYTLLTAGTDVSGSPFADTTATNGVTYYYVVSAFDGSCQSVNSSETSATPCAAPNPPSGLAVIPGGNRVSLSWTAPAGAVTSYNLKRSTTSGDETFLTNLLTMSFDDTSAVAGATYYYEVTALQGACESGNSAEASATPCAPPNAPTIGTAVLVDGQVTVNWTAPDGSPAAASYNVKRSSVSGDETNLPAGIGITDTSFTDTTAVNGTPYYYVVSAIGPDGCESFNSAEVTVNVAMLADMGGLQPSPGSFDISQFSTTGNTGAPGGKNYFSNNGGGDTPPGQTFTTPGGAAGYFLTTLSVETGNGNGNGIGSATDYTLYIFSVSGTTATLLSSYDNLTTGFNLSSGDWLDFSGLTNILLPNATYAYAISTGSSPYTGFLNASGQPYAGGLAALIPAAGGTITPIAGFDSVFDIGLIPVCSPPGPPTAITATPGDGEITVAWTAPAGTVTDYNVKRSTVSGEETALVTVTNTFYVDTSVDNGTTYYYVVTALQQTCESTNSAEVHAVSCSPSSPPTILSVTPNNGEVTVSWAAPGGSPAAVAYNVKRSTAAGAEIILLNGAGVTATSFNDTSVSNGTTYYYVVSALSAGSCESANSAELSTTPCSSPNSPANPSAAVGNNQITIAWTAPAGIVTGYNVYRSSTSGSGYTILAAGADVPASPFTDTTAVNGTQYYYVVTALQGNCEGANSSQVTAVPCNVAQPPTAVAAVPGNNLVTIRWTPPSSGPAPSGYSVKRSMVSDNEATLPAGANVNGTSFVDAAAVNGTPYYYVVSALNGNNCESANSAEVSVNVTMLADIGPFAPIPGTNDLSQFDTTGNQTSPDGLNYYDNNSSQGPNTGCGQTFTTGANSGGYELSSLSIKTGGLGSGNEAGNDLSYTLFIYATNNAAAQDFTLVWSGNASSTLFADGDWWQWSGLTNTLAPNTTYAWSMYEIYTGFSYYEAMAVSTTISNGVAIVGLPASASGTASVPVTGFSAVFDIGLIPLTTVTQPVITGVALSGSNLVITGQNGTAGESFTLLTSTNLALPLNQWTPVSTNIFGGSAFTVTNTVNPASPANFFILRVP